MADRCLEDKLIEEVRVRPFLHDPRSKNYNNHSLKHRAWEEIGNNLGESVDTLKTRWRSLRDTYRRFWRDAVRSKQGYDAMCKTKWPFMRVMDFMADSIDLPQTPTISLETLQETFEVPCIVEEISIPNSDSGSQRNDRSSPVFQAAPKARRRKKRKIVEVHPPFQEAPETKPTLPVSRQITASEHFLLSIMPDVESLSPAKRIKFQMDVLSLLLKAKTE